MSGQLSTMKNISQTRAKFAWDCANKTENDNKEYGSIVGKIPSYIKTNGLLNTLAFLYSKKGKNEEVLKNIREWLTHREFGILPGTSIGTNKSLLEYLTAQDDSARTLIACTSEVLALFNWLRRFAKSE